MFDETSPPGVYFSQQNEIEWMIPGEESQLRKIVAFLLLMALWAGTQSALSEKGTPSGPAAISELLNIPRSGELTIMVYLCGSNLEEIDGAASKDILEMARSGFSTDDVNVIVRTGGARRWTLPFISSGQTGVYQIGNNGLRCLYLDEAYSNMGDPETLKVFLDYGYTHFPAKRYALVLWNHGGGSLGGICRDMIFEEDSLSMPELSRALGESPFAERKLDWIGFDACVMGSGEVAQVIAPYARYMIASEEYETGTGWSYDFLGEMDSGESPVETGIRIADRYVSSCQGKIGGRGSSAMFTLSCIDLSRLGDLKIGMEQFFSTMELTEDQFPQISRARRRTTSFGRNEEQPEKDHDLIDLGDMIQRLSSFGNEAKAELVLKALDQCVPFSRTTDNGRDCSGLTVYFPFYNEALYRDSREYYGQLSISDEYTGTVTAFGNEMLKRSMEQIGPVNSTQLEKERKDNRSIVQLRLEKNQARDADLAEIIALQRSENENGWHFAAKQRASIRETGMASGEYVHTNLFVVDERGNPVHEEPMQYVERDDGLFSIPVRLKDADQNEVEARLVCHRDPGEQRLTLVDVYLYDEATGGFSSRLSGDLSDYVMASYRIEEKIPAYSDDQEGSPLLPFEDWEIAETVQRSWDLSGDWSLSFVRDYLDIRTVSVLFQITDVYNHVYLSPPVRLAGDGKSIQLLYDDHQKLRINPSGVKLTPNGVLFMRVKNTGGEESLLSIRNLKVNGADQDFEETVPGFGEKGGLDPEEEQMVILSLPMEEGMPVQDVSFEFVMQSAEGSDPENIAVQISIGDNVW